MSDATNPGAPRGARRRALVTGASQGIGRGIALSLADAGMDLALVARGREGLDATVAQAAPRTDGAVVALTADLAVREESAALAERAAEALGGVPDVFVHCSGIARNGAVGSLEVAEWDRSMEVNVTSAFVIASDLVPAMREQGWGRIVTICSLYSRYAVSHTAAYASSKHALHGLTRVLAAELAGHGGTANAIMPGWVDTEMVRGEAAKAAAARGATPEEMVRKFLRNQPINRMVDTSEVGALTAFLCSDAAAAINGQGINIDGGSVQS
ncbi:SDR family oxidoreductase [Patulibacter brassicae]|uniref:SDR family oxidoreductase n=1 Tax=Patulibacter brassicae TaxID=1705717 RepID=A0ABU4VLK4_9ACTN|nr:SDR family oxidoreductase [Patulibacter brassicae]MDX8152695.1 SDR family oxidoreductase [Patulibacter brassicae]